MQRALEILDGQVASWWKAPSVEGLVRSRVTGLLQSKYYSHLQGNDQPVIVVDQHFTAGQTAQAIIAEVTTGLFAHSIGAAFRKYRLSKTLNSEEFRNWQKAAVGEAARLASILAEWYINGIATLTPAGDLVVTLGDLADNGPRWDQLLSLLPLLAFLPIGAIVIKFGKRTLKVSKKLAQELEKLTPAERRALFAQAAAAKTDQEAIAIIERGVAGAKAKGTMATGPSTHPATLGIATTTDYKATFLRRIPNLRGRWSYIMQFPRKHLLVTQIL